MGDSRMLQGLGHGDRDLGGQLLKLDDFGGDFHLASMCNLAQKSSEAMCVVAESVCAHFRAHPWAMATQPKSEAVQEYRRQIALYLQAVKIAKNWGQVKMGDVAGVVHTTIGRALKGDHTLNYPALLALEEASGVPIPEALTGAARAIQQPTRREAVVLEDQIRSVAEQLKGKPKTEQDAIIEELRKALAKTS